MTLHGGGDHVHTRAVIVRCAERKRQQNNGAAAEEYAQIAVWDALAKGLSALPQRDAVDDAQHRARRRDSGDRTGARPRKRHRRAERERLRRRAERAGKICRRERRGEARQNGGKVEDADACDLHRKYRRRERRAEERREHAAHAAHDDKVCVLLVEPERPSQLIAEHAAELQRRALASGAAAEQMRDRRADKNERRGRAGNGCRRVDGEQHAVRVRRVHAAQPVKPNDQQAAGRQKIQKPRVHAAKLRRLADGIAERRADQPAERADRKSCGRP